MRRRGKSQQGRKKKFRGAAARLRRVLVAVRIVDFVGDRVGIVVVDLVRDYRAVGQRPGVGRIDFVFEPNRVRAVRIIRRRIRFSRSVSPFRFACRIECIQDKRQFWKSCTQRF